MKRFIRAIPFLAFALAIPGTAHAQWNSFTSSNDGRGTAGTPFFSNTSADGTSCNLGFFAQGSWGPCSDETAGTTANQGLITYTDYWGVDAADPGVITSYSGTWNAQWELTLIGSVAGGSSEIGWWWHDGASYHFTSLPAFGAKTLGSTVVITVPGSFTLFGLYISNAFNPDVGGCKVAPNFYCSDADGGISVPTQQWAFLNNGIGNGAACQAYNDGVHYNTCYLWGAEDNKLELLADNQLGRDSDYNDYLITMRLVPEPVTMGLLATGLVAMAGVGFSQRRRKSGIES